MVKEKPAQKILIVKTRQSQMKDSSLKNNNLIRILYRTDNSSTPILNIIPSKGFFGLNYILLHNLWSTTVISMRFYIYSDAVLEYGSPLSAADYLVSTSNCHAYTGREIIPKSFCFLFSKLKIQYQQHSKGIDIFQYFLTSSDFLLCDAHYFPMIFSFF